MISGEWSKVTEAKLKLDSNLQTPKLMLSARCKNFPQFNKNMIYHSVLGGTQDFAPLTSSKVMLPPLGALEFHTAGNVCSVAPAKVKPQEEFLL